MSPNLTIDSASKSQTYRFNFSTMTLQTKYSDPLKTQKQIAKEF